MQSCGALWHVARGVMPGNRGARQRRGSRKTEAGGLMAVIVFMLGAAVGMAVLVFAFENQEPVTLHYLYTWQTPPIPLFALIMAAVGVGFVIAGLFGLAAYLREHKIIRQQRRTIV